MCIKLKIDTLRSIIQHFIIYLLVPNDLLFSKSFNPFRIPSYSFNPISYLVLLTLIHIQDWVSVDSNLPYLTPVISSGE